MLTFKDGPCGSVRTDLHVWVGGLWSQTHPCADEQSCCGQWRASPMSLRRDCSDFYALDLASRAKAQSPPHVSPVGWSALKLP